MVKIFIDPGHGGSDAGAVGNGISEKNITLQIAKQIQQILLNEYQNVSVKMSRTGDQTVSLNERTAAANNWGADFYLSVHINAGGGTGFESYVYPNVDALTKRYQDTIHDGVLSQTDFRDRGQKESNFHVLRESKMPALLTENGFIDNASDASKLKNATYINKIARGHVNGLVKALNLQRKASAPPNTPTAGKLYRVQIGAFTKRENAEALAEKARKAGFQVYIVYES
jgi:N-acetylmuramoyl-L-alanine amidase